LKILEFSKTLARANQTCDEGGLRVNGNCWNVYCWHKNWPLL